MIDTLLAQRARFDSAVERERLGLPETYGVVTLHRPSNVDDEASARAVVAALDGLSALLPLVIPLHPRGRATLEAAGPARRRSTAHRGAARATSAFLSLVAGARLVLTDSGGIQEETTILDVPCLTMRPNTERPITVSHGTNRLVAPDEVVARGARDPGRAGAAHRPAAAVVGRPRRRADRGRHRRLAGASSRRSGDGRFRCCGHGFRGLMRLANVVGTRPQLIKAAALQPALRERHEEVFIDTGQHWDEAMAGTFFGELGLRAPDRSLGIGGGTAAEQTGRMLVALEGALRDVAPDAVVVYGDTNSTLAATLVAAKLDVPVAHVEAGLRSFDRRMPEEINRDRDRPPGALVLRPDRGRGGQSGGRGAASRACTSSVTSCATSRRGRWPEVRDASALADVAGGGLRTGEFLFATVHRAENRAPDAIRGWVGVLDSVARADRPVVLALHPGTREAMDALGVAPGPNVIVVEPLGYRSSLAAQLHAAAVLTDSGGVQREAAWLGTPCLVLRGSTEWVETTAGDAATSVLVGLDAVRAREALDRLAPPDRAPADGRAPSARAHDRDRRRHGIDRAAAGMTEGRRGVPTPAVAAPPAGRRPAAPRADAAVDRRVRLADVPHRLDVHRPRPHGDRRRAAQAGVAVARGASRPGSR